MYTKKMLHQIRCFIIAVFFAVSIMGTVEAVAVSHDLSMDISGSLTPQVILPSVGDGGFVSSYSGDLTAYAQPWVHTGAPKADPDEPQGSQALEITVFLEELRPIHPLYKLQPSLITYHYEDGELVPWEHTPNPIFVFENEVIPEIDMYFGVHLIAEEDKIIPFRTTLSLSERIGGEWHLVETVESSLGLWYMDVSPYNDNADILELP